ncbi:hypothetical protein QA641_16300 [Bradyrhizobium sp. CB1650]|uniref:hypothetical protein n=1 Tax=Bradyrhizobium sp. CB1650 TaxID=3039153 RepID=UPI002434C03B|nr:hypothetical protein [Bradyrhizobium sp. CB1650]WGD55293.1 hypothetical protein QA641_16300 [Bradyrhizobium sp. CB1650]
MARIKTEFPHRFTISSETPNIRAPDWLRLKFTFEHSKERIAQVVLCAWGGIRIALVGRRNVAGREYLNRQAATLLKFAKTTTDPMVALGLVEKAADLKEQAEEPRAEGGAEAPDAAGDG